MSDAAAAADPTEDAASTERIDWEAIARDQLATNCQRTGDDLAVTCRQIASRLRSGEPIRQADVDDLYGALEIARAVAEEVDRAAPGPVKPSVHDVLTDGERERVYARLAEQGKE